MADAQPDDESQSGPPAINSIESISIYRGLDQTTEASDTLTTIYFETKQLDDVAQKLPAAGFGFDQGPHHPWLWREARWHDPANNSAYLD